MNDKEKIKEARRQIHELFANISETKEIWLDESVNHEAFNTPKQFSILLQKAIFLGTVKTDLENIKKILEFFIKVRFVTITKTYVQELAGFCTS